ncbi:hypothetical protein VTO73DRAFT_15293 [Trametes versicolor]
MPFNHAPPRPARRIHHRVSVSFERPAGRMGFNFASAHSALGILFQAQREQIQDCPDITLGLPSLARFAPLFSIRTVYLRHPASNEWAAHARYLRVSQASCAGFSDAEAL